MKSDRARLVATPVIIVVLRLGGALASFVVSLLLARTMDPGQMGHAMVLMSLAILLGIVTTGGMEAGAVRFIAKYKNDNALSKAHGFLRLAYQILFVSSAIVVGLVALAWLFLPHDFPEGYQVALYLALITACLTGGLRVGSAHAMAFGKVIRALAPSTFIRQLFFLVGIAATVAVGTDLTAFQVILLFLAANIAALGLQAVWNRGVTASVSTQPCDTSEWPIWIRYGFTMAPTLLFVQYSRDLALLFAAWGLSGADLAVLGVTTAIVAFAKFAVAAVNQSITPKMAALIARDDTTKLEQLVHISNHMKVWPVLIVTLLFATFGDSLLAVFGPAFAHASPILLILMVEPLALALFGPSGQFLSLSGRQAVLIPAAVCAVVFMAFAVGLGAIWFGLYGATIGVATSWLLWSGGLALYLRLKEGMNLTIFAAASGVRA